MLKITNSGKETAYNIITNFDSKFMGAAKCNKTLFENLQSKPFIIEPGKSNHYIICAAEQRDDNVTVNLGGHSLNSEEIRLHLFGWNHAILGISGSYCGKYKILEQFSIDEFITESSSVDGELADRLRYIQYGVSKEGDGAKKHKTIQECLNIIADKINNHYTK